MSTVSIIVPVYNVESYLDDCVKSIVRSRLKDIEILLVDDGSTDSSGDICDFWSKKMPQCAASPGLRKMRA